jgi:hypothetical protein
MPRRYRRRARRQAAFSFPSQPVESLARALLVTCRNSTELDHVDAQGLPR